jgi:predicted  nucleic acid-binding Zn-ribbon protein
MRIRHRVPSIFNLSMVDVLCCALGCVILLWLLNLREARQRTEEAGRTDKQLTAVRQELAAAAKDRDELRRRLSEAGDQIADLGSQYRSLQAQLAEGGRQLDDARKRLVTTQGERDMARTRSADLEKKLAAAGERLLVLETAVKDRSREAEGLAGKLDDADARLRKLQALADQVPGLRDEVKTYRDKLATEEALAKGLEKEMGDRLSEAIRLNRNIKELQAAKRALEQDLAARGKELGEVRTEADRLRASVDNRFAGVTLTGRRVIFLVDMSGSMELLDEQTQAPAKWQAVRETLAKVLRSMPDVEQFQVIVFANQPAFLLGKEGRWLTYDPQTSTDQVNQALAAIKPEGGTNMYAAMDAAFQYRSEGLDTIYLLSDGLPNKGEPLRPEQLKTLSETEKGEILGKYIRRALKASWNRPIEGQPRVRINAIGFFYESPDVGAFLWALARENDGSFVGMSRP